MSLARKVKQKLHRHSERLLQPAFAQQSELAFKQLVPAKSYEALPGELVRALVNLSQKKLA